ncbi:MAG: glycosyltransferase [Salinivirgaceae bacterium]|nr:glycosyltransferase [Salinivirgaceae bacterium]
MEAIGGAKRKVIFFMPNSMGGAERVSITIAKSLDLDKYDVQFVVVGRNLDKIVNFIPNKFSVRLLKIRNIYDFAISRLVGLLRNDRPAVVFCSLNYLNVRIISAARIVGGIKIVVRCSSSMSRNKYLRLLARLTYRKADIVVAQTNEMRIEIIKDLKTEPNRVQVLHNPIDKENIAQLLANAQNPYSSSNVNIVSVARFVGVKGIDTLINAFSQFSAVIDNAKLYVVGNYNTDSKEYISILTQINKLGLQQKVQFVGLTTNPYQWIKYADCFVLASRQEGLPNALLEAIYLKTPVVCTLSVPIIRQIVENGVNGYIVPIDDVDAMTQAMTQAIKLESKGLTLYQSATTEQFSNLFI